jgi:hypothetical protein
MTGTSERRGWLCLAELLGQFAATSANARFFIAPSPDKRWCSCCHRKPPLAHISSPIWDDQKTPLANRSLVGQLDVSPKSKVQGPRSNTGRWPRRFWPGLKGRGCAPAGGACKGGLTEGRGDHSGLRLGISSMSSVISCSNPVRTRTGGLPRPEST